MGLCIIEILQPMLEVAPELVGLLQHGNFFYVESAGGGEIG